MVADAVRLDFKDLNAKLEREKAANIDVGGRMPRRVLQPTAQALIWRQHKWLAAREDSP